VLRRCRQCSNKSRPAETSVTGGVRKTVNTDVLTRHRRVSMATVRWRRLARRHFERRVGTDTMMARVILGGTTTVVVHPYGVTTIAAVQKIAAGVVPVVVVVVGPSSSARRSSR